MINLSCVGTISNKELQFGCKKEGATIYLLGLMHKNVAQIKTTVNYK
jgi:hypothetical protein